MLNQKKNQKKRKSDKHEIEKRILEIYTLMTRGFRYSDLLRYATDNWEKISSRQVDEYIKRAREKIRDENSKTTEELRTETNARYDELYIDLRKQGKTRDAGWILSQKAKINGLEIQVVKHEGSINIANELKEIFTVENNIKKDKNNDI